MDSLRLLATVAHLQAEKVEGDLRITSNKPQTQKVSFPNLSTYCVWAGLKTD
jgi:hypothetical protein